MWPVIFGMVIILVIIFSPVAGMISKTDLISYYSGVTPTPIPTPTPHEHPPPCHVLNGSTMAYIITPDYPVEEAKALLLQKLQTKKRIVDPNSGFEAFLFFK